MKIAFVLYPQVLATGISIPAEMYNAAAQAQGDFQGKSLSLSYVAERKGAVPATGGVQLVADSAFSSRQLFDWVFIPPMWGTPWKVVQQSRALQSWVVNQYQQGSRIVATGSGVAHLAAAGLLDKRVATTHWYYLPRFQKRYPQVEFQQEHFITHQDGIYCAGSINSQTDLVLYFIRLQFGEKSLALVEQQFMHELKRSFSTPFYEPGGGVHPDEVVSLAQSWLRSNLSGDVTVADAASYVGQSERQLRRRFKVATDESPQQFLSRVRVEESQSLLRETNLAVADIASACGYHNVAYFSRLFKKQTSLSPSDYRKVVRKKRFSEE
ncbi:GlxA family transcriptional regulator [Reinekea marinisedimentorum]|uniref:Transcriptional regulator GlxA family with amidase domain n=1 Tax=Reinekea marinisedimentorum TaxID=230495 RepID=A0A4R3IDB1_9GAMM|nr:helix-turn-helix domain-containing protein [Reinekea marinisedimentorum]TCS42645.1 transcriptional regulator GlxA family with amidase domain [Reinekea marinisedimentorum]